MMEGIYCIETTAKVIVNVVIFVTSFMHFELFFACNECGKKNFKILKLRTF